MSKPLTLTIHGLHQTGIFMQPIAKQLRAAGFKTYSPTYRSLSQSIHTHAKRIHEYLSVNHDPNLPINLVGHSLGGLVIRQFINQYPIWRVHRCVSLGTPHQGSLTAVYARRLISPLIGQSFTDALDGTCPLVDNDAIEFGVIAGNKGSGLGVPFLLYHNYKERQRFEHDGTVFLFETTLPNARDYLVMPVTHTGFLTNKEVGKQIIHFLEHGHFARSISPT